MNRKEKLKEKLELLSLELNSAKKIVDDRTIDYLCRIEKNVDIYIEEINLGELGMSQGGNLGFKRAIIEYDNLAAIDSLYNAAREVDTYYSNECKIW